MAIADLAALPVHSKRMLLPIPPGKQLDIATWSPEAMREPPGTVAAAMIGATLVITLAAILMAGTMTLTIF